MFFSDDYLVRVKAQVMTRDDATGGWVPMGIGGLSIVGLRKLVVCGEDVRHEYLIHGQRISDQSVSIFQPYLLWQECSGTGSYRVLAMWMPKRGHHEFSGRPIS